MNFKAAVLFKKNKVILENLEVPKLKESQVLVKILYTSICKTQIGEILGQRGKDKFLPHCLGHEATGIIIDKNKKVKKVKIGDKVCLSWIKGKGNDSGGFFYKNIKGKKINAGPVNTFSEYSVVSENRVFKLSKKDDLKTSVLLGCALPTGFNSIFFTLKDCTKGPVFIFGCGGVGLSTILACKKKKLKPIIAIDVDMKKLKLAKKFGADQLLNFSEPNFYSKIDKVSSSNFPVIIECTGKINILKICIRKTNSLGGKLVVIGNYPKGEKLNLDPWEIIMGKTLTGAWNERENYDNKFKFFKSKIDTKKLNLFFGKKIYNLSEINKAIKDFKTGKVVRPLIKI